MEGSRPFQAAEKQLIRTDPPPTSALLTSSLLTTAAPPLSVHRHQLALLASVPPDCLLLVRLPPQMHDPDVLFGALWPHSSEFFSASFIPSRPGQIIIETLYPDGLSQLFDIPPSDIVRLDAELLRTHFCRPLRCGSADLTGQCTLAYQKRLVTCRS
jgi:hypothetical protein